jgi:NAD+ synthase/NAD+ synthase (glutamine-hydrolysing)
MRLALIQTNPTVGDLDANAAGLARWARQAKEAGADLAVFPELSLCGYPPKDLLLQPAFIRACARAAKRLGEEHSTGITIVFGTPLPVGEAPADQSAAPRIANALLAYRDGQLLAYYDKRLLPTYDVFDEDRYFTPGDRPVIIDVSGVRVGLSVCEDLWHGKDAGFSHHYDGVRDPVSDLCKPPDGSPGAQVIINPSASPFVLGKGQRQRDLLAHHAQERGVYVCAVNQVGGNDELIFDGHAAAFSPRGDLVAAGPGFAEAMTLVNVGRPKISPARLNPSALSGGDEKPVPDPLLSADRDELLFRALTLGIRDYARKTGFTSAVLGLSGGIDSAVTAVLAAAALGPGNVLGASMPGRYSSEGSITDARLLADALGVRLLSLPIDAPVSALEGVLKDAFAGREPDLTEENLQSRVRGTLLMALSNKFGHLLLTTGNKSELAVGYCTLYGDMNGGLAVLSDITKELVYSLAGWINRHPDRLGIPGLKAAPIPIASITKPPSAELRPNQTDQDSLPPYPVLDDILSRIVERRQSPKQVVSETGYDPAVVKKVARQIDVAEYKRKQAPIGLKVTGVAFGSGRRMPIAQGYRPEREIESR